MRCSAFLFTGISVIIYEIGFVKTLICFCRDFTDLPDMCNPLHKFAADQRFEASLTGVSLLNTPSGFCLIQVVWTLRYIDNQ